MTMPVSRRRVLGTSAVLASGAVTGQARAADTSRAAADPTYTIRNHGIRHTVMGWCFNPMDTLELARHAKAIGLTGIEGIDRKYYADVKELGLEISLTIGPKADTRREVSAKLQRNAVCDATDQVVISVRAAR